MPHFGLMNTQDSFETEEGALLRARLHIRAGKRRLRQGKISAGILTLYDAFLFALRWYLASPGRKKALAPGDETDVKDEKQVFDLLRRAHIVTGDFDNDAFDLLVEKAAREEMPNYDYTATLRDFEELMTQLGVMPFDEDTLPPEDPATF
jgi:hypothetical protein